MNSENERPDGMHEGNPVRIWRVQLRGGPVLRVLGLAFSLRHFAPQARNHRLHLIETHPQIEFVVRDNFYQCFQYLRRPPTLDRRYFGGGMLGLRILNDHGLQLLRRFGLPESCHLSGCRLNFDLGFGSLVGNRVQFPLLDDELFLSFLDGKGLIPGLFAVRFRSAVSKNASGLKKMDDEMPRPANLPRDRLNALAVGVEQHDLLCGVFI
jgi:hypothetical protein